MNEATLYAEIAKVCPIISVAIGNEEKRETWSFVPEAVATSEQIAAGDNVIATIPIGLGQVLLATVEWIGRWTNAEYRAFTAAAWRGTAGNAKNADVVLFEPVIDLTRKKTITLRDSLVTDGILTAERAAVIFS